MSGVDWVVLASTLLAIVLYGMWRTRGSRDLERYFRGDHRMKWGTIGLSVMATQASAITFLSTPGFGYEKGMMFVQNYLGLPLALVIVSALFIPAYFRANVYTSYEYLERRFDLKTRQLGALLFLVQRGLSAGITIYAPAIILSNLLGWDLRLTILAAGGLTIAYTVSGGSPAVSLTQKHQMAVIMTGMVVAFAILVADVTKQIPFSTALGVAGRMGRLEAMSFSFDPHVRYTFWSGMLGGLFLALSYFGTDQSQVGRYLTGASTAESRLGLMFNAVLKIPMQFFILFVGVMVCVFYQFTAPPLLFKKTALQAVEASPRVTDLRALEARHAALFEEKRQAVRSLATALERHDDGAAASEGQRVRDLLARDEAVRTEAKDLVAQVNPAVRTNDTDYVFLTFVLAFLPRGVIGLLIAVIFCAALSASASEINALGSTTTVDLYRRLVRPAETERHYVRVSKVLTACWGMLAIGFALFAGLVENLIEAVNILGSLFYGTILGLFLTAFLLKKVRGTAVFLAALGAEAAVIALYLATSIGYLWFNVIGCALVLALASLLQTVLPAGSGDRAPGGNAVAPALGGR
ncbi:MAG TPA: sodium:solute symporter [Candidatus Polarisedimenticolia bacterium]|nr:sodium:solute symporter [Candidatus Polarisedimenticolia bacterium]